MNVQVVLAALAALAGVCALAAAVYAVKEMAERIACRRQSEREWRRMEAEELAEELRLAKARAEYRERVARTMAAGACRRADVRSRARERKNGRKRRF